MKKFFVLIAAAFLSLGSLAAQQMPDLPNDPAVRKGQLDNGLTYYIRHNALPEGRAEFYLATNVGAIQETPDQDGLAHFLEHMCFNGTKNFPDKKLLDYLQSIGASFGGNVNASTGVEQTIYMLTNIPLVNETVVDTCIMIMHDYSHFVTNAPEEIDKERGVIIEERRQRRDANWRMHEKSLPYYYGDSKYGSCTLIGSQENLETFKPESLVNFYQTWYHPDMQALIVVGDIDVDEVEAKIARIFADIPAAVDPKPKDVIRIPDNVEPIVGIITDPEATNCQIEVLWKSEAAPEELNSTMVGKLTDLLESIIGQVMSERFGDITARPDAPYLSAALQIGNLCETMDVVMGDVVTREGETIQAFASFMTEIEKMKRYGFSAAEIDRAKENIRSTYETLAKRADTRQNAELVGELIYNFFDNETYMVPAEEYELVQQLLEMITPDVVNMTLQQIITDENMVVLYKGPEKEGLVSPTEEQLLAVVKAVRDAEIEANAEEAMDVDLLDPSKLKGSKVKKAEAGRYGSTVWTLKNGVKVFLKPTDFEKDVISFNITFDGGLSLVEDADMASFEDNVFGLFQQNSGVSRFPATTLTKMLSGKNVSVNPYFDPLHHGISGSSTPKDLETALQLMYLAFTDPRFDADEYAVGINTINAVLPNLEAQSNYKFQDALYKTLYTNQARHQMINSDVVAKANLATIEKNYRRLFKDAAGAKVFIVGDFTLDEIKPLVEKYFGSLPKGKKATRWIDRNDTYVTGEVVNDFKADMQTPMTTVIEVFNAPMKYSVAKQYALDAASYILNMRYVTSLREDEGGTYGASTAANLTRESEEKALLQIYFNCKPASADKLIALAAEGLNDLAQNGPTAEEFDMAVKNSQKNLPERRITNSYWSSALILADRFGEDIDALREAAISALTPESISAALQELLASGNVVRIYMRPGATGEAE